MALFEDIRWLKPDVHGEFDGIDGPFLRVDLNINKRIYLFMGEVWKLPVDAIVIGQNEELSDRSECDSIFALSGPECELEMSRLGSVQTGNCVACTGANLCPYLICSVGPKYDEKYLTASEHALFSAYKSTLLLASQTHDIKTIAFSPIYLRRSHYPRDQAAHIALRTIRRFLEHDISLSLEKVILCVPNEDFELYQLYMAGWSFSPRLYPFQLFSAYFSRTEEEALNQSEIIPGDLGDEWGDVSSVVRTVRITSGPKPLPDRPFVPLPPSENSPAESRVVTGKDLENQCF